MPHGKDSDRTIFIINNIQYTVITNPKAILLTVTKLPDTMGTRIIFQSHYLPDEASINCLREPVQFFLGRADNADFIAHF